MSYADIENELANNSTLVQNLSKDVSELSQRVRQIMSQSKPQSNGLLLVGPGANAVSSSEFRKFQEQLEARLKQLEARLEQVEDVAFEAVRILDKMAGMGE